MSLVTFGSTSLRLSPPGRGRIESAATFDVSATGAESNAAVAATHAGMDAAWLSKVADTTIGDRVVRSLREHGVTVDVLRGAGRQGIEFFERGSAPRADRRVEDVSDLAIASLDPSALRTDRIASAGAFYTSEATVALSQDLVRASATLLRSASDAGVPTAFGLFHRASQWGAEEARETVTELFPAVDVLFVTEDAATDVLGRNAAQQAPRGMAAGIASEFDLEAVAMVREDRGALVIEGGTVHEREMLDIRTVDASGAQDAFAGVFLARRIAGASAPEALADATAAATLARTTPGPYLTASPAELDDIVERMDAQRGRQ